MQNVYNLLITCDVCDQGLTFQTRNLAKASFDHPPKTYHLIHEFLYYRQHIFQIFYMKD